MTIFGVIYVCLLGSYIIQVRYTFGGVLTLFLFAITWMNDTGAYFIGSLIGKHKLLPKVSPKKTVEGLIGGIIFSLLVGIIAKPFLAKSIPMVENISSFSWFGICFLLSMSAHIGDLSESLLKRFAGVGNSFDLLPGHGGILDKIDSLLFTSPILYLIFQ
jgi:phosphatidate cytidylyltransferase